MNEKGSKNFFTAFGVLGIIEISNDFKPIPENIFAQFWAYECVVPPQFWVRACVGQGRGRLPPPCRSMLQNFESAEQANKCIL